MKKLKNIYGLMHLLDMNQIDFLFISIWDLMHFLKVKLHV
jgi:hypothetical protein